MAHAVVIAGLGLMGRRMLGWMQAHPAFDVVAGFDPDDAAWGRAEAAGAAPARRVHSLDALVDAAGHAGVLYIATPPASHPAIVRAGLARGLAIFCEKPLAIDVDDARRLVVEAEAAGMPTAVNFPFASMPQVQMFREACAAGRLGAPVRAACILHFSAWPRTWHTAGPWLSGAAEGGFLREVFSHFAYLTQQVLGEATWTIESADVVRPAPDGAEVSAAACLRCGGTPVLLMGGAGGVAPDFNRWTLYGSRASVRLTDWAVAEQSDGTDWTPVPGASREERGARQLEALADRLAGDASPLPTLRDALAVQEVVEGLFRRARVG